MNTWEFIHSQICPVLDVGVWCLIRVFQKELVGKFICFSNNMFKHFVGQIELQKVKDVLLLIHSHFQTFSFIEREGVVK